ncbi:MAG TPA: hypothetical protein VH415_01665 [Nitrososphaeraceae archaeon]|jgi:hypothetical protein
MKPQPETGFIDYKIQQVLGMDESVLSVAIVDSHGTTLGSRSKYGAQDIFSARGKNFQEDFGIWIRAALAMIIPFDEHFGNCSVLSAFYDEVKIMILPIPEMEIFFVLVCLRSANAELILCKFREIVVVTEGVYRKTKKNLV